MSEQNIPSPHLEASAGGHTPGPWEARTYGNGHNSAVYVMVGDVEICEVFDDSEEMALDADANARLIAAAPEMHSAGVELLDLLDNWMMVNSMTANDRYAAALDAFRAAITKAGAP